MTRRSRAVLLGVLGALATAAPAIADSASVAVLDAWGRSDPVAGVGRTFVVTGTSSGENRVYVKSRMADGVPCGPSSAMDPGSLDIWDEVSSGAFSLRWSDTWRTPGAHLVCTWIAPSEEAVVTPSAQVITARPVNASVAVSVAPQSPAVGRPVVVTVAGTSEAAAEVDVSIKPAGAAFCAEDQVEDPGAELIEAADVLGDFQLTASTAPLHAQGYEICVWVHELSDQRYPFGGTPKAFTFKVTDTTPRAPQTRLPSSPTRRCLVPAATPGMTLAGAQRRLVNAKCKAGATRRAATRLRAGRVVRMTRAPGTVLPARTKVGIVVSTGPARRGSSGGEFRAVASWLQPLNRNAAPQRFQPA